MLPVIGEQLVLEREAANPHDEFTVVMTKDSQVVGTFREIIYGSHDILLYEGLCHLLYYWRRRKGKGLEVPYKCLYYGSTKEVKKLKKLLTYTYTQETSN